jgi:hypothetical protein
MTRFDFSNAEALDEIDASLRASIAAAPGMLRPLIADAARRWADRRGVSLEEEDLDRLTDLFRETCYRRAAALLTAKRALAPEEQNLLRTAGFVGAERSPERQPDRNALAVMSLENRMNLAAAEGFGLTPEAFAALDASGWPEPAVTGEKAASLAESFGAMADEFERLGRLAGDMNDDLMRRIAEEDIALCEGLLSIFWCASR